MTAEQRASLSPKEILIMETMESAVANLRRLADLFERELGPKE